MPDTLFISDLHLSEERPGTLELFYRFLTEQATGAEALSSEASSELSSAASSTLPVTSSSRSS